MHLTEAGYVLDEDTWRHRKTNRMINATVAENLTFDQLSRWIDVGDQLD